jgi:hypothetical protein
VIFQSKSKTFYLFVVVFLCISAGWELYVYDSQVANRSVAVEGGSHRESSLLPISSLGVIYESQLHAYVFFYSHPE